MNCRRQLLHDVLDGLSARPKRLPCKWFYDERGSKLFDRICELEAYYLTRTELSILRARAGEIARELGSNVMLVELGSGSSNKTRLVLDELADPAAYVPVDIADEHLAASAASIAREYPKLEVIPVCDDYTRGITLPKPKRAPRAIALYFPGSTIGNLTHSEARQFLTRMHKLCGPGGAFVVGVDLKKEPAVLHLAYNDPEGVTAEFNLNLLLRINEELGGTFEPSRFHHYAFYSPEQGRIEMHLVSACDQSVRIGDSRVDFKDGETIVTEYSYKYSPAEFAALADEGGFDVRRVWYDDARRFSVQLLVARG